MKEPSGLWIFPTRFLEFFRPGNSSHEILLFKLSNDINTDNIMFDL